MPTKHVQKPFYSPFKGNSFDIQAKPDTLI